MEPRPRFTSPERVDKKEKVPPLKFAHLAPHVWQALTELNRKGWVTRGFENPETVAEHTNSLRGLAAAFPGLQNEERQELLDILEIHDWAESIVGDEVAVIDNKDDPALKAAKFEKEKKAMEEICGKLGGDGKVIMDLWIRYENGSDPMAKLAKELDKYQAVEMALKYEKSQGKHVFIELLEYSKPFITHPTLLKKFESLQRKYFPEEQLENKVSPEEKEYTILELLRKGRINVNKNPMQVAYELGVILGKTVPLSAVTNWELRAIAPVVPPIDFLEAISIVYNLPLEDVIKAHNTSMSFKKEVKDSRKSAKDHVPKITRENSGWGYGGSPGRQSGKRNKS
jgi:putative hydrolase of HD superfamily